MLLSAKQKVRKILDPKWKASVVYSIPKQSNSYDCGFFTLCYIECIKKKVDVVFFPDKM